MKREFLPKRAQFANISYHYGALRWWRRCWFVVCFLGLEFYVILKTF
jgi:uncharacterized membrane protein